MVTCGMVSSRGSKACNVGGSLEALGKRPSPGHLTEVEGVLGRGEKHH